MSRGVPWEATEAGRRHAVAMLAAQRKCEEFQERTSPYRAAQACDHANVIETTCHHVAPTWLDEVGACHCWPMVRSRHFECGDCGVGVWPASDAARQNAERRPVCIAPACNCFDDAPPLLQAIVKRYGVDIPREKLPIVYFP